MTEPGTIYLPNVTFDLANYNNGFDGSQAAKQAFDLFEICRTLDLPSEEELDIIGFNVWPQAPWAPPAGYYGDVPWMLDHGGAYCERAFYPEREDVIPFGLNFLGAMMIGSNAPRQERIYTFPRPWKVRPGDLIITGPQCRQLAGVPPVYADIWASVTIGNGRVTEKPGIIDHQAMGQSIRNNAVASLRTPIRGVKCGGSQIRFALQALQHESVIGAVDVGLQLGDTGHMTGPPTPVLSNGQRGVTIPRWKTVWTDWTDFNVAQGANLLVHVNNEQGARAHRRGTITDTWYSTTNSDGVAELRGSPVLQHNWRHCVLGAQVR